MRRLTLLALAPLALAGPALAQHDPHAGHDMHGAQAPAAPSDPHAGHSGHAPAPAAADPHAGHGAPPSAPPADPHAGHAMHGAQAPAAPSDPHAGHSAHAPAPAPADPHAGHAAPGAQPSTADPHAGHGAPPSAAPADPHAGHAAPASVVGNAPAPPVPTDHAADGVYPRQDMDRARALLRAEHGRIRWSQLIVEQLEFRPSDDDGDGYAWEAEFSTGGDINRFVLATEGEGGSGEVESLEVQALYSRAISPYFNLRAGLRHDFEPRPRRTYAVLGVEGLAPYWIEVSGELFVSNEGEASARIEASTDFRLTQKLVLQPKAELNAFAEDVPELGVGSGVSDLELSLRLRYHLTPDVAPYVGVIHERAFGGTADFARAHGEHVRDTRAVIGLRASF